MRPRAADRAVRAAPVLALLLLLAQAVSNDLRVGQAVLALLAVGLTQVVPGMVVWRSVRPVEGSWAEDVAVGTAVGIALSVPAVLIAATTGVRLAGLLAPVVAAVVLLVPTSRRRVRGATMTPLPLPWGASFAGVVLLAASKLQSFEAQSPLYVTPGFHPAYVDDSYHLSIAAQLLRRGPGEQAYVAGQPLLYHWFSHAWAAQTSLVSGVELDAILFRVLPVVVAVVVPLAVAAAAMRLSGRPWVGPVAALISAGGNFDPTRVVLPVFDQTPYSPSFGPSTVVLLALVVSLVLGWRGQGGPGLTVVTALLALAAGGLKASALPLLLAGLALALVAALVLRSGRWRVVLRDLLLVLGCFAVIYVLMYRGATSDFYLSLPDGLYAAGRGKLSLPGRAPFLTGLGTLVVVVVAVLARAAGLAALVRSRRRALETWLVLGTGLAGAGAALLLAQPTGVNQWWFTRGAAPLVSVGSAMGLDALLRVVPAPQRVRAVVAGVVAAVLVAVSPLLLGPSRLHAGDGAVRHAVVVAGVCLILAAGGAAVAGAAGPARRRTAALAALVTVLTGGLAVTVGGDRGWARVNHSDESPYVRFAVSTDQVRSARWLRDNSSPRDVVATNRHCAKLTERLCDNRRFVVAAYTERRVLVEGWGYLPRSSVNGGREYRGFFDRPYLRVNDVFFTHPSRAGADFLWSHGVRWLWLDPLRAHARSLAPWALPAHQSQDVQIYRLLPPA